MRSVLFTLGMAASLVFAAACGPSFKAGGGGKTCDGSTVEQCQERCDQNEARACYRLAWFHEVGIEVKESPKKATELYDQACEAGMAVACRANGQIYWDGEVVKRDMKKGIAYFQRACGMGLPEACPTEAMIAESEGRKPKRGFDLSVEVSTGEKAEGGAKLPSEAPEAPSAPSVP